MHDMDDTYRPAVQLLVRKAASRVPLGTTTPTSELVRAATRPGTPHYANQNPRLGIDFSVERLTFPHLQTMDPRIVRIAPGRCNEYHRHAHESVFVVLEGEGEVFVGAGWHPVRKGDIAFVPRWGFHQTRNISESEELVVLAITDFGFTSAVLGDYDHRTRLARHGDDAALEATPSG